MKGSVAAFACAAAEFVKSGSFNGSISMLITGDEEGVAVNGTTKVLEWMKQNGHVPDVALVGEPTNPDHLGQEIKIGRRGSLNGFITVTGKQGHVAYQHLAQNPLPALIKLTDALASYSFDEGNEFFPADKSGKSPRLMSAIPQQMSSPKAGKPHLISALMTHGAAPA